MGKNPPTEVRDDTSSLCVTALLSLDLENLWKLDAIGVSDAEVEKKIQSLQAEMEEPFAHTTTRDIEGRYEVALPWVQDKERIPSNGDLTENQISSVRRKLEEVGDMKEYGQIFEEWMNQGIIEYAREIRQKVDRIRHKVDRINKDEKETREQEIGEFPNNDHGPTTPPSHLGTIILQLATVLERLQPLHPRDLDLPAFDEKCPCYFLSPTTLVNPNCQLTDARTEVSHPNFPTQFNLLLHNYQHIFSENKFDIPTLNIPTIKINTTSDKIITLRPYRVPYCDLKEIQNQVAEMLKHNIIEKSYSPFASPVTLVTKRDKTKHFCIDYRKLNDIIQPDIHPLPLIDSVHVLIGCNVRAEMFGMP
ncbi:hypothetical protein LAZ67_8003417 [Cordylochernes scorpioides]|uniref:Gag-pol polyprotein n=1 Tax=Cordylochernes scorpioides TaxID=51811 RepID=A0ABY6KRI9_9ARAC|nr:hypothetical protein LAZ67_8003417 [Cordylochernes scorpioides]